jgi:dihydrofolate reductase
MLQPNIMMSSDQMMPLAIIVAMTSDRVIGTEQGLPWHLPEELQHFKRLTIGGTVIMGRKTHDAIGRPLPGRHNIVLSRSLDRIPGVQVCDSFMAGLTAATKKRRPIFVIGGVELYRKALQVAVELHISWIKERFTGDIFFPEFNLDQWTCCSEEDYRRFHYRHYCRRNDPGLPGPVRNSRPPGEDSPSFLKSSRT